MKNYFFKLSLCALLLLFASCIDDKFNQDSDVVSNRLVTIKLNKKLETRGDDQNAENVTRNIQLYVFDDRVDSESTLLFVPERESVDIIKEDDGIQIAFKIPKEITSNLKIVVLANSIGIVENTHLGITLEEFRKNTLMYLNGKYDVVNPLPMTAMLKLNNDKNSLEGKAQLTRSLARLSFQVLDDQKEFEYVMKSISSIRIYGTNNVSQIYPNLEAFSNDDITLPSIPVNLTDKGQFNTDIGLATNDREKADASPLYYNFLHAPSKSIIDKVYIPESYQPQTVRRQDAVAVVVGVQLVGYDDERFYRLDLSDYELSTGKPINFKSVLRNHSYCFNLKGASTDGADLPEEALVAPGEAKVEIVDWQEYTIDGKVLNGDYSLRIETDDVVLGYKGDSKVEIKFDSNFSTEQLRKSMSLAFVEGNNHFSTSIDFVNRRILVQAKAGNLSKVDLSNILKVRLLNHSFTLNVRQQHKTAQYTIAQRLTEVNGVYVNNKELSPDVHNVKVRLFSENEADIKDLTFRLKAHEIEGIYIDYEGAFGTNIQTDVLNNNKIYYEDFVVPILGKSNRPRDKKLTIESDSEVPSFLNITIPYSYTKKKLLGVFGVGKKGLLGNESFEKLISTKMSNFGVSSQDIVKSEGIEYVEETSSSSLEVLINKHKPDIIILGEGYNCSKDLKALELFMTQINNNGGLGAVINMNNDINIVKLLQRFNIMTGSHLGSETINLDEREYYDVVQTYHNRYKLPVYDWDKVTNGKFSELGTSSVKLSVGSIAIRTLSIRTDLVVKYTGNLPYAALGRTGVLSSKKINRPDYAYSMFRLRQYPFLYIGDNHFITNSSDWRFTGQTISRKLEDYGVTSSIETYKLLLCQNGLAFANMLHWALHITEYGLK